MEAGLKELIASRREALTFYSPYSFIREIRAHDQVELFVKSKIEEFGASAASFQMEVTVEQARFVFLYEYLVWDSQYFNRDCYKLYTVLYGPENASALIKAINIFKNKLREAKHFYCFIEIPAEDSFLIQCLNEAGIKLVETRLHYFRKNLDAFTGERYPVRRATQADIAALSKVAATSRNKYDRLHADYAFSDQEADNFLATYAKAAVNGFCDEVMVPDVSNLSVASFIAFDYHKRVSPKHELSLMNGRLAAVAPENRGWYVKLMTEFMHQAKEQQISYVKLTTQASNKVVIKTYEKLGCSFGALTHVLSFNS